MNPTPDYKLSEHALIEAARVIQEAASLNRAAGARVAKLVNEAQKTVHAGRADGPFFTHVTARLDQMVAECTKDPAERYAARALRAAVQTVMAGLRTTTECCPLMVKVHAEEGDQGLSRFSCNLCRPNAKSDAKSMT